MDTPSLMPSLWYIPSFYGDLRLERSGTGTRLSWENVTPTERRVLESLFAHAVKKDWAKDTEHDLTKGFLNLSTELPKVQKFVVKALKPGRQTVDFVQFSDGKIEEIRHGVLPPASDKDLEATVPLPVPAKAATVAKPTQGCPEPRLAKAELRAREVLFAFLNDDQQNDFEHRNAFVTEGAGTGHRYIVTSRHARDQLAQTRRQLYDLDDKTPFCVHDYSVPAAEEMLALHLLLQSPEHERYLRHLE
jgi:hypothetical protein